MEEQKSRAMQVTERVRVVDKDDLKINEGRKYRYVADEKDLKINEKQKWRVVPKEEEAAIREEQEARVKTEQKKKHKMRRK